MSDLIQELLSILAQGIFDMRFDKDTRKKSPVLAYISLAIFVVIIGGFVFLFVRNNYFNH